MLKSFQINKSEAKIIPIFLCIIGIDHLQEPVNRPKGSPITQCFVCTKGTGELILEGQKYIIHPNEMFILYKGTPHSYRAIDDAWTLQILGFDGDAVQKIMSILKMSESGVYKCAHPKKFIDKIKEIEQLSAGASANKKLLYSSIIYNTLLTLSTEISEIAPVVDSQGNPLITSIMGYLESNYKRDISLSELSQAMERTPAYLCSIFKQETGRTIVQALTSIRLVEARIMLGRYPEKTVGEIGQMCGFQSPSYFCKTFKKYFNMTPNNYRTFYT